MELALGTVQFGMGYGIAGSGSAIPSREVRSILRRAHGLGIRILDTAFLYGDIEERLFQLMDGLEFCVVSKLPPLPPDIVGASASKWAAAQVRRSYNRLGSSLSAILFHRADDLLGPEATALWQGALDACEALGIGAVGISVYDPLTLASICQRFPIALAQLPGNAFDQRVAAISCAVNTGVRPVLHLRSAFLQGLLLMTEEDVAKRLPVAVPAIRLWHSWCLQRSLSPLQAALSIVKGFDAASYCIVGVDSLAQLEQIVDVWHASDAIRAPELATFDPLIIDPRLWKVIE